MTAATPAAFLDRDGVLNVDVGYPHRIESFEPIPGGPEAVALLKSLGYRVIAVSNQSGVARGYFSEEAVQAFNQHLQQYYAARGAVIDAFYYCPFHPKAVVERYRGEHEDRKPNPGMIECGIREYNVDRARSFMIGDNETDIQAARNAQIPGYLFREKNLFKFIKKNISLG